jgi:CheY-like chemotaxis protein
MVHGLAEQSGGRLELRSRPNHGTAASLWLPAELTAPVVSAAPTKRPDELSATAPLDVLVVDDDALVLLNTAAMLEDMGHRVVTAPSGSEALLLFEGAQSIDLVITDQGMPGMTGLQLIEKLRGFKPRLPVVLATGYAEVPADSAQDHVRLSKPFFQRQLAEAVEAAINPGNSTRRST